MPSSKKWCFRQKPRCMKTRDVHVAQWDLNGRHRGHEGGDAWVGVGVESSLYPVNRALSVDIFVLFK